MLAISKCTEICLPFPALSKGERLLELVSQQFVIAKVVDKVLVGEIKLLFLYRAVYE
jgi:hypothetical protein